MRTPKEQEHSNPMTFRGACGCPLGPNLSSPRCALSGGPATWCSGLWSTYMRSSAREEDARTMMWAGVIAGDLVRGTGGMWWEVLQHELTTTPDGWRVEITAVRGTGGVVVWAKTEPTPWEIAAGWRAFDPYVCVHVLPSRGTTVQNNPEQAETAARTLLADRLGGVEITT